MPSLRKRVSSYLRQLSFHHEPHEKHKNLIENTFILKYLQGDIVVKEGPVIHTGKVPTDLPSYELGVYKTGPETIIGCYSGPDGGLTAVKRKEKHLSLGEQDIDFIDTQDEQTEVAVIQATSPVRDVPKTLDNSTMVIKMAGQEYLVTNRRKSHSKSHSLGSLKDFDVEVDRTKRLLRTNNNNHCAADRNAAAAPMMDGASCDNSLSLTDCDSNRNSSQTPPMQADEECGGEDAAVVVDVGVEGDGVVAPRGALHRKLTEKQGHGGRERSPQQVQQAAALAKSQSAGNPFRHPAKMREGRIRQLAERPSSANVTSQSPSGQRFDPKLPPEWNRKSDFVYGISDSLYDKNLSTKVKNGNPIADCFGIITRNDSAILAVADGVNWGEKAAIAAKSAVHGCLHYLNKTIFLDTRPFDNLINKCGDGTGESKETPIHEFRTSNSKDIFVCLLRAFNCAHDLILENNGMLTTLTVAIVLPLKDPARYRASHVVCVCNVGDSLAYVYSQSHGIRELTKGSHDITSNRDMRDALGALGPVDGIKPELSNLTLSITTLQTGDIVMVASDGLTDNFDPTVCKFAVNTEVQAQKRKPSNPPSSSNPTPTVNTTPVKSTTVPQKPPRKNGKRPATSTTGISTSGPTSTINTSTNTTRTLPTSTKPVTVTSNQTKTKKDVKQDVNNPLVAQFLKDNPIQKSSSTSAANTGIPQKSSSSGPQKGFALLRSKTALDFRSSSQKAIPKNPDGLPYITPVQKYEITLLMIEDILKKGISGKEHCTVTARKLCESLVSFTLSITAAKRRTLEDNELYFNNQNGVLVEASNQEKKMRRKRALERVQNLPGKLDHVTVVACNVGNRCYSNV